MTYGVVYGLYDPRTNELRYVGQTMRSLKIRLRSHVNEAKSGRAKTYSSNWIRSLLSEEIEIETPKSTRAKGISTVEIHRRLSEGQTKIQIAKELGVSRAFVYLRLRQENVDG